jgi:transcription-repair coupling factor (superfamily II helicase)
MAEPDATPLPTLPAAGRLARSLPERDVRLEGMRGGALAKCLADARGDLGRPLLAVVPDPETAEALVQDLTLFGGGARLHLFSAWDVLPAETDRPDPEVARDRVAALRALETPAADLPGGPAPLVVAPVTALMQPTLPPASLRRARLAVRPGTETSPEALIARLVDAGFEVVPQVSAPGEFSRRGGIVDVFPFLAEEPLRLEFFGDEVDTIRPIDLETQRSRAPLEQETTLVDVTRDAFGGGARGAASLFDYLPEAAAVLLLHPERIATMGGLYADGFDPGAAALITPGEIARRAGTRPLVVVPEEANEPWPEGWRAPREPETLALGARSVERLSGGIDTALGELRLLRSGGARVTVFCNNPAERARLRELLLEKGGGLAAEVELRLGRLSAGFVLPPGASGRDAAWAALGDHEIFGRYQLRRAPRAHRRRYVGAPIGDFTRLRPGDPVVHILHGIARFVGIETLESGGTEQDFLALRFAEDAKLYVPLSHVELVQRYVGSRDARPKLSKLGGKSWARRKRAVQDAVRDVAADLLRTQAVRRALPGIPYPGDDEMQREFEAAFPYEETPDQLAALADIKTDQEAPQPMDRLLCGDVGFGKTEVAIRAAFKTVNAGKQVAVLVPTTILAEQHARTFRERLADYPLRVAGLSRFRTAAEARRIVAELREGTCDIVIGTHRLLSKDVAFRDLGLVVIDEEQRFGVEHKERLKAFRASVDVLTMTATPIPRTLHMALLGLRDISNLATPPLERHAIRTFVVRTTEELVRRAILRELARGGQCYFLHNRVQNIGRIAEWLAGLVPEARFAIAHGQLPERDLLGVMTRFLEKEVDVLVTTTIIESGVDIPTVNTLFVHNADHFGLSELHQLRGRVGRYRHQAYAYFLVPPRRPVSPVAQKRLHALEEYAELGAGFRIALRDLEIRGAGNLLGVEQSGHIHLVGFDLYCRLLERAVREFRGEAAEETEPVELDLGTRAYVPTEYIPAETERIDFYRRLASAVSPEAADALRGYLRDRYGPLPGPVAQCFRDERIRHRAREAGVNVLGRIEGALVVGFAEGRGGEALRRLRAIGRKVTGLDRGRWRVALGPDERTPDGLLPVVEEVLERLETPAADPAPRKARAPAAARKPVPAERGTAEAAEAEEAPAADPPRRTRDREADADAAEAPPAGAAVVGLEPNEALGLVGAIVPEESFDVRRFGPVTLVHEDGARHFLRFTGTGHAPKGRVLLTLRAESPEEVRDVVNAHLAAGGSRLHEGIVEAGEA